MTRQPTALQDRVLRAVWHGIDPGLLSAGVHDRTQVRSRAINLCVSRGWLTCNARGVLRLTTAGRRVVMAGWGVKS